MMAASEKFWLSRTQRRAAPGGWRRRIPKERPARSRSRVAVSLLSSSTFGEGVEPPPTPEHHEIGRPLVALVGAAQPIGCFQERAQDCGAVVARQLGHARLDDEASELNQTPGPGAALRPKISPFAEVLSFLQTPHRLLIPFERA